MLRKIFAVSEQGAKNIKKGILYTVLANLTLMLPVPLLLSLLREVLKPLMGQGEPHINIWFYMGIGALIVIAIYAMNQLQYDYTYTVAYEESADRRITLAEKIRLLPLSYFGNRDLSDFTTIMMSDCTGLEHTFSHAIPQGIGSIISLLLVCIGLFLMEWRMALAVLIALPASLLLVVGSKKLQDHYGEKQKDVKLIAYDAVQECLENVRDLKINQQEKNYLAKVESKLNDVVRVSTKAELVTSSFVSSGQGILKIGFAAVIWIGGSLIAKGQLDFMTYLIFLFAASRIYEPISVIFTQITEIFLSQVQIKRQKEIENYPVQEGSTKFQPPSYTVEFKNVDFAYNENKEVLHNVSFTAKQGEVTAFVGPSGSGKSTIGKLSARFWDPTSGTITIGGIDITTIEPETLLKHISIVFQDVVLFGNSIRENIRIGKMDATEDEIVAVAKLAQCDDFIRRFPEGYDTILGENGTTLSGGERQRISIARALLKDAPIILLDEATASLDVENETLIQQAISHLIKNKTVLVIAHRMRTISSANRIIVLEKGKVIENGNHEILMTEDGLYKHLIELQENALNWSL